MGVLSTVLLAPLAAFLLASPPEESDNDRPEHLLSSGHITLESDSSWYFDERAAWPATDARTWRSCGRAPPAGPSWVKEVRPQHRSFGEGLAPWPVVEFVERHGPGYESLDRSRFFVCLAGRWVGDFYGLHDVALSPDLKEVSLVSQGAFRDTRYLWRVRLDEVRRADASRGYVLIQDAAWLIALLDPGGSGRVEGFLELQLDPARGLGGFAAGNAAKLLLEEGRLGRGSPLASARLRVAVGRWLEEFLPRGSWPASVTLWPVKRGPFGAGGFDGEYVSINPTGKKAGPRILSRYRP